MSHGDDVGLVLPPAVAPVQVAVVPIVSKASAAREADILAFAHEVAAALRSGDGIGPAGADEGYFSCRRTALSPSEADGTPRPHRPLPPRLRVAVDSDLRTPPGQRFYAWERAGVPVRLEVGLRDLEARQVVCKPRLRLTQQRQPLAEEASGKVALPADASLPGRVLALLQAVQEQLFVDARCRLHANLRPAATRANLLAAAAEAAAGASGEDLADSDAQASALPPRPAAGAAASAAGAVRAPLLLVPLADDPRAEAELQAATRLTVRCFPSATATAALLQAVGSRAELAGIALDGLHAAAAGRGVCAWTGAAAARVALVGRAF